MVGVHVVVAHIAGEDHYLRWDSLSEFASGFTQNALGAGHFTSFEEAQGVLEELKAHMQLCQDDSDSVDLVKREERFPEKEKFHRGLGRYVFDKMRETGTTHMQVRVAQLEFRPKTITTPNNYFHVRAYTGENVLTFL